MALPYDPVTPPVTTNGVVSDPEADTEVDDWSDLSPYTSPPTSTAPGTTSTSVPTTYDALSLIDFIDFKSHFDPGDLSHGVNLSVRIPEDLSQITDILCHRPDVPFSTKSEIAREGIYTLAKGLVDRLRIHDPMLLSLMAETSARAAAKFAVDRHAAWLEMRENLEIQLLFWLDRGEPRECGRAIQEFWDNGKKIVHPAWRDHVCALVRDQPLVKAAALAAGSSGFPFTPDLLVYSGGWT
jgi:hypothetical protein